MTDRDDTTGTVPDRSRVARLAATATVAVVVALGTVIAVVVAKRRPAAVAPPPAAETRAPERLPSVAQQTARNRLGQFRDLKLDLLEPPETAVAGFSAPIAIAPPYEAQDSAMLDATGLRIRLAWIGAIRRSGVCLNGENLRFACGLQSRASLQNMVRGRKGLCWPVFWPTPKEGEIYADCFVEGRNLALEQVRAGFALPLATVTADGFTIALEEARTARVGVWNGGYQVVGGSTDGDRIPPIDAKTATPASPPPSSNTADPRPPTARSAPVTEE